MKSISSILLLTSFLVLQYARQVNYWECRLSNYFKSANQKCDCEKLLNEITSQDDASPVPAVHTHFHLDDSFYPSLIISAAAEDNIAVRSWFPAKDIFTGKIRPGRLDRPPQFG